MSREAIAKSGTCGQRRSIWDKRFDSLVALLTEDCVKILMGQNNHEVEVA